ncbi:phosphatase PAP2 family protein [Acinetobacter courvalinii]|uniref:phosphatase PAP2 family protein n=1 Tax=Acinetobacter courvalinii TaxID=280147 RepID=UPI0021CFAE1B|nr:phosphatase PAP2 family protein [Acinetobacter courvalinii]MCU4578071.1 phosphatase PAP2 family protein [Acinetobacter courvalinii]
MIFKDTNIALFNSINTFAKDSPVLDKIVIFLAEDLNTVFISFLVLLLVLQWKTYGLLFAKTLLIVLFSLVISDVIEFFYHHPRPFQLHLGDKLIGHGASSSFPSQHTLTIVIIAFSYLLAGFKKIGIVGLVLSLVVGASRVFVGVHFPFDIVGSFIIGFLLVVATNYAVKEMTLRIRRIRPIRVID